MEGFEPSHTDPESAVLPLDDIPLYFLGRAGRIRTPGCQDQNLVPYRLATALSLSKICGGEGGIRTLGELLTHTRLAGVHLQPARSPLQHQNGGGRGTRTPMGRTRRFSRPLPYQLGLVLHRLYG